MSGKDGTSGETGSSVPSVPSGSSYYPYQIIKSGVNNVGNGWDTRIRPGGFASHYSNADGSYYYSNANGTTYYDNGYGGSIYTAPSGYVYKK
ncbi:hypothetical protein Z517_10889 [Fonsecaea pedrosoi CBS 271.37]|uniref:Uncharacterized protein n=1 Tax=Fonsecaea pedrosoi CBS 271.37 TaxID=1442368 RepID=A0A0D2GUT3_9EURO|nr:uncharacterized protein Z517_10889 [Fonsecaea pedrosoi CBS 271.37]KIW76144.1 hypothetical protein Z517_10889 [Fonsecaea pedrosoi CBS 271.37]